MRRFFFTTNHIVKQRGNDMPDIKTISVHQLRELSQQGKVELIDVRTPAEFREVHADLARNVPLESLDPAAVWKRRKGAANDPLYVICRSGGRSLNACKQFIAVGALHVVNVDGGTWAWAEAGLPVVRGKETISLERQVRIAAGMLVLGFFVNPYFIGLSAFVGAGLTFAGITDTCGMGMMLAKMPWNQVACDSSKSEEGACCSR